MSATIHVGEVSITPVVEIGRSSFPTASMLPDSTAAAVAAHHDWLKPDFFDEEVGDLASRIQTFVVRTPQHTILVDTGVGNDKPREGAQLWHMRQGRYLNDLAASGVLPEDVAYVVCTHLHVDHVGWNTRFRPGSNGRPGEWVPTFPRARYIFAGEEWEYWRHEKDACIADSVVPVVEAGQAMLVGHDYVIDPWIRFEPSPGHTPGHVCLRLRTTAGEAVFAGDLMHRTVQVAEPQWSSRFCYDPRRAAATRRDFVERHADTGTLILAAHFPRPGYIVRTPRGTRFSLDNGAA
jgi:glyoxylase-like metal-dependent hydrolase (beta-lactamase superfamily II)